MCRNHLQRPSFLALTLSLKMKMSKLLISFLSFLQEKKNNLNFIEGDFDPDAIELGEDALSKFGLWCSCCTRFCHKCEYTAVTSDAVRIHILSVHVPGNKCKTCKKVIRRHTQVIGFQNLSILYHYSACMSLEKFKDEYTRGKFIWVGS